MNRPPGHGIVHGTGSSRPANSALMKAVSHSTSRLCSPELPINTRMVILWSRLCEKPREGHQESRDGMRHDSWPRGHHAVTIRPRPIQHFEESGCLVFGAPSLLQDIKGEFRTNRTIPSGPRTTERGTVRCSSAQRPSSSGSYKVPSVVKRGICLPWRALTFVNSMSDVPDRIAKTIFVVGATPKWVIFDCRCGRGHRLSVPLTDEKRFATLEAHASREDDFAMAFGQRRRRSMRQPFRLRHNRIEWARWVDED